DTSTQYLANVELLANVYTSMGDYGRAAHLYNTLINQNIKMFGEKNIAIVAPTIALAKVRNINGDDLNQTVSILENVKNIVKEALSSEHPLIADISQLQA